MRLMSLIPGAFALLLAQPVLAQKWFEYSSRDYGFMVNFPDEPKTEDTAYTAASGATLPARRFSVELGTGRYAVTVVDFSTRLAEEEGAMAHAASLFRPKGQVRFEAPSQLDGIPGLQLSIIEPNGRQLQIQLFMYSYMGLHRLYIGEASAAANAAPPAAFWTSLAMIHPDGRIVNINRETRERTPAAQGIAPAPGYTAP